MLRTHSCGELRLSHLDNEVTLCGWVQRIRKMGAITFIDLRDRYGITQLLFNETVTSVLEDSPIGREYVLQVWGKVIERSSKNLKIPTGEVEVNVSRFSVLNASSVPPFTIEENTDGGEELRMQYRYLDLRRPQLQRNLQFRYDVSRSVRNYLHEAGFLDIETPFLIRSTPEGARDFVVPSRLNEGQFYALPQSPQTFKQLLMVSGYDRYYQIVKCFRDEALRADRQPEFTQVDCEMSFVEQEDILQMFEGLLKHVLKEVCNVTISESFPRMTFRDAMFDYGNDKPDTRFEMKLQNLKHKGSATIKACEVSEFKVIADADSVIGVVIPGASDWSRKQIDEITEWVKRPQIGMTGLMWLKSGADGTLKSSFDKFFSKEQLVEIAEAAGVSSGDLLVLLAGEEEKTRKAASELRLELGNRLGIRQTGEFKPLWIVDFPLFEYADEDFGDGKGGGRWVARHHPFTSPKPEHIDMMSNPDQFGDILANAYDIVLNGTEIGGGSIRIHNRSLQEQMFKALGFSKEEAQHQFGFLLGAFDYGAPPHGGLALGFDRLCALLSGQETIRDFIAFPKNNSGKDVMLDAPAAISKEQYAELGISHVSQP